jgi:autotransporter-associated beta strand protein
LLTLGASAQSVDTFHLVDGTVRDGSLIAGQYNLESGSIAAMLAGGGVVSKNTGGTVTLGGANTLNGLMEVTAGTLAISGVGKLTSGSFRVSGAATVLQLGESSQNVGAFDLLDGTVLNGVLTASSVDLSNGLIGAVLNGGSTLTKKTSGTVILTGANTLSGRMDITAGTLALGGAGLLTSGSVRMSGAATVLDLGASVQSVGAFSLVDGTVENGTLTASGMSLENGVVGAVLNGGAVLTKTTGGTVLLNGANTLGGTMDITAGTLAIGGAGRLTTGSVRVSGSATVLELGASAQSVSALSLVDGAVLNGTLTAGVMTMENGVVGAVLDGGGTLTKSSAGTVVLSGANTLAGLMDIGAGTLAIGGAGKLTSGSVRVSGSATVLDLGASAQSVGVFSLVDGTVVNGVLTAGAIELEQGVVSAVLDGGALLTKKTTGKAILSGTNTLTGMMDVSAGTLALSGAGLLTTGSVRVSGAATVLDLGMSSQTVSAFSLVNGLVLNGTLTAGEVELSNGGIGAVLNGGATVTKKTAGTVVLSGANTLSGVMEVTAGKLAISGEGKLTSGSVRVSGATTALDLGASTQSVGMFSLVDGIVSNGVLTAGGVELNNGVVSAVLNGGATVTKSTEGTVTLSGANTLSGLLEITAGTLALGGAGKLASGTVRVSGAATVLTLGSSAQTLGEFGLIEGTVTNGTLTADSYELQSGVVSAVLAGGGLVSKNSGGTVTLSGVNTLSGLMEVTAGTLAISGAGKLTSGTVRVSGAATLLTLGASAQSVDTFHLVDGTVGDGSLMAGQYNLESGSIAAVLNGGAVLTKSTSGTVTLSAENRLSGSMNIANGVVSISGAGLLSSGSLSLQNEGAVLELGATAQSVGQVSLLGGLIRGGVLKGSDYALEAGEVSAVLAGTAALTKSGAGLAVLSGVGNTFSGATTMDAGTLRLAGTGVQLSGTEVHVRGGLLEIVMSEQINNDAALLISGGSLSLANAGIMETVRTIQVTGGNLITAGTLVGTGNTVRLEGGTTTVSGGGILRDHHIVISGGVNIVEAGGLLEVQSGNLGLELSGANNVSLTLNGGSAGAAPAVLSISNAVKVDTTLGSATISSTGAGLNAGRVDLAGGMRDVTVLGGAGAFTLEATVLNGGITKLGAGTLALKGMTAIDKGLDLREGTLELAHVDALRSAGNGPLVFSGGALKYGAGVATDVSALIAPVAAYQVLRIDTNGQSVAFAQGLSGEGSLEKNGVGSLTLAGSSSYRSGTVINGGSLVLGRNDALYSSGTVLVNDGASLALGTTVQNLGNVTLNGGTIAGGVLISPQVEMISSSVLNGQLAGGGSLLLTGAGTLFVASSSNNFYGTTVIGGSATLQLGVGADSANLGTGMMVNNGTLAFKFASGTNVEFANSLSGSGAVVYLPTVGEGAMYSVKFVGVNTSTGGTTLGAGVVFDLSSDALLGAGTAGLTLNGGTVELDGGADVTIKASRTVKLTGAGANFAVGDGKLNIAGVVSGSGGITKDGAGVMVLSNDNTYTGQNTIAKGVLQIGDGGATGSLGLGTAVALNSPEAQLVVNRGNDATITQSISGTGTFTSKSAATLKITGDLSGFSGQMVVKSGTLKIANAGLFGLGTGPLTNEAVLEIDRSGPLDIPGSIGGSGNVKINGSSATSAEDRLVVTLESQNTFTGETELIKGTLVLTGTSSLAKSSVLRIQDGGVLDVSAFNAQGGYVIPAGQKLMGNGGQILGTIQVSGALSPGNSPGSIRLGGLTALPGSDYAAEFNQKDGRFDQIIIDQSLKGTGIVDLSNATSTGADGTIGKVVIATAVSRTVQSETYSIITGGTINGTFDAVTAEFFRDWVDKDPALRTQLQLRDPLAFGGTLSPSGPTAVLIPHLHYTKNEVLMEVERKPFRGFGLGINAQEIGGYLDAMVETPGDLLALQVQLEACQSAGQVTAALAGAGVSPYADLLTISRRRMLDLNAGLGSRLDLLGLQGAANGGVEGIVGTGETGWSVWQSTSASQMTRQAAAQTGFGGYNSSGESSVMGVERPFGAGRVGLLGAVGSTSANFQLPYASIKSETWHLGGYMSLPVAPFFADVAFIYGRVDNDARRNIEVPGYTARTRALFGSDEFTLRLGGGIQVMPAQSAWEITPTEHLLYVKGAQAALEETGGGVGSQGGGLGARIQKAKMAGLINEVGLTVGRRWVVRTVPVAVRLKADWVHDFDGSGSVQASFVGAPESAGRFVSRVGARERDAFKLNASVEVSLTQRLSLRIGGEHERRKSSTKSSLTISIGMEF